MTATPAIIGGQGGADQMAYGRIWFSPKLLAQWWSDVHHGRVEQRVASEAALTDQAKRLGLGGKKGVDRKQIKWIDGTGGANYWRLSEKLSEKVIERAEGLDMGVESKED